MEANGKMNRKANKESGIFMKCVKAPKRFLIKARDVYIRSLTDCSCMAGYGSVMACPAGPQISTLPKSFSINSSLSNENDDFKELIRIASTRNLENKVETELHSKNSPKKNGMNNVHVVPRSRSVAIERIDEDKPCDFGEDVIVKTDVYPRSRSYAVSTRRTRTL